MPGQGWQSRRRSRSRHDAARTTPTGWTAGAAPGAETVVAVVGPAEMPVVLARLHGAGYGHLVRVLDPARGDVRESLRRAGITADLGLDRIEADASVILIQATGRAAVIGDLLLTAGAREVRVLINPGRSGAVDPADEVVVPPDLDGADAGAGAM
ncbi:MAG: hypothetical protein WKF80_04190 [Thermomicrobiales bacterium]